MSSIRFSPNLFLESQELNRFQKSLQDDGFRKLLLLDTVTFGLFDNSPAVGTFDNFLVQQGTNVGSIKHNAGYALTSAGNLIYKPVTDNIALPNDNTYYWLKIAYLASPIELGTISVDVAGNMTGTGTEFLKILRGQPNIPSRISFPNAVSNTGEYDILSVSSDTAAVISVSSGVLVAESNLTIAVVGSFSPDYVPATLEKYPFQYDSCTMTLVTEAVLNTPPALSTDLEFYIARVRRNGAAINIEDQRTNIFRDKGNYLRNYVQGNTNPLIGIEGIKFADSIQARSENLVFMAWTFRSTNWTINTNINQLTINAGLGGKFKSTADFTNGDFDGWRVYVTSSPTTGAGSYKAYFKIRTSSKSGGQINLILDSLQPSFFSDTAQEVIIAPDADEIEILFSPQPADTNLLDKRRFSFPINEGETVLSVPVYKTTTVAYNVKYRYKNAGQYRAYTVIPSDPVGLYNEAQWDANGNLIGLPIRTPYTNHATNGFIILTLAANSFINRFAGITTGDVFGVTIYSLTNASPVYSLQAGIAKQRQLFTGSLSFSVDQYINLITTSAIAGNSFILDFRGTYTPGAFNLRINQDFINPGTPGINLATFSAFDFSSSAAGNLVFIVYFDGANWRFEKFISTTAASVLSTRQILSGTGLTGGGDLTTDRTLALAAGAAVANLGFTPVQQGTGAGMLGNTVKLGWSGGGVLVEVDVSPQGRMVTTSIINTSLEYSGGNVQLPNNYKAVQSPDGIVLYTKVLSMGDWNMDTTGSVTVAHGLNYKKIRSFFAIVRDDNDQVYSQSTLRPDVAGTQTELWFDDLSPFSTTDFNIQRRIGGIFDNTTYNATSFNRGWVTVVYEA